MDTCLSWRRGGVAEWRERGTRRWGPTLKGWVNLETNSDQFLYVVVELCAAHSARRQSRSSSVPAQLSRVVGVLCIVSPHKCR